WILVAFEAIVVLVTLLLQNIRLEKAATDDLKPQVGPLRSALTAFLIQFVVSRVGFLMIYLYPDTVGGFGILWFLGSIIVPLMVLGLLSSDVRREMAKYGIT